MQLEDKVRRVISLSGLEARLRRERETQRYLPNDLESVFKRIRKVSVCLIEALEELSDIKATEEDFAVGLIADLHIFDCDFIDSNLKKKLADIYHSSRYQEFRLTDELKIFLFDCYIQYWESHPRSSMWLQK